MLVVKYEAALLIALIACVNRVVCTDEDVPTYLDEDLKDETCGGAMDAHCCPNLRDKYSETVVVSSQYKGGPNTCRCRCSVEKPGDTSTNKILKEVQCSGGENITHYFCMAGFGERTTAAPGEGANGEAGAGGSVSGASILQMCKVMVFVVLMAAGAILVICN